MSEQSLDEVDVASQHRSMKSGIAVVGGIRIGALLEQQRGRLTVAAMRGKHEGAGPVRKRIVDVGAGGKQQTRRARVARSRREQQRCAASAEHRIVQLFATEALRLLTDDRLRVGERLRVDLRSCPSTAR